MKKRAILFVRVSSKDQDYKRQIRDLTKYSNSKGLEVVGIISEKISGVVTNGNRDGIIELMRKAENGEFDKVVVTELSRLGRSAFEIITLIQTLSKLGISVVMEDFNIETLDEKGKKQPMAEFMIYIISQIAQMERETLINRIKSGLENAKANGKRIGRVKGSVIDNKEFLNKYFFVVKDMQRGLSLRKIAKLHSMSLRTVQKVKKLRATK
ncbi:MAG: hypothetical protein COC01_03950 [Bacteroidetes bacterium]|nr:MAG: hypothetical protein COC01_03950 [Bacteroidota bacterium]